MADKPSKDLHDDSAVPDPSPLLKMSAKERAAKAKEVIQPPPRVPVHYGDLNGPSGNTMFMIGQVKESVRQLTKVGVPIRQEITDLLDQWTDMDREGIMQTLRDHTDDLDGSFDDLDPDVFGDD